MNLLNQIVSNQRLARWDIRAIDVALFICLVLGFAYVSSGTLNQAYVSFSGSELDSESLWFLIVSGFGLQLGCILAWVAFQVFVPNENRNLPDSFGRSAVWGCVGFAATYLAILPIMLVWRSGLDALDFEYELQLPVQLVQNGGSPLEMLMMSLLVVVGAPIGEELVYRGFFYRFLHRRISDVYAIGLTSALFAIMHFNLYSFMPLFALGIGLCLVYRITGNLISCIVMHACFNGVNFAFMMFSSPVEL